MTLLSVHLCLATDPCAAARSGVPFHSATVVYRADLKRETRWSRGFVYRRSAGTGGVR
jgi:hypothetical protein